jgi:hypothetical protein
MTTVASRVVRSSPHRDTPATWQVIVDLLTQGASSAARTELLAVEGVVSAVIAERAPKDAAIVVTCDGPRTRIYCLYDEDAIEGSDAKEDSLGYDPLAGDWRISIPCPPDDLAWVQRSLKAKSTRVTARDLSSKLGDDDAASSKTQDRALTLDLGKFLKS